MKPKNKPASKIPTTQTNTNQKKKEMDMGGSILKKNEFTLIIAGALVVTLFVFFLFFRSSGPESNLPSPGKKVDSKIGIGTQTGMADRIGALELAVSKLASSPSINDTGMEAGKASDSSLVTIEQRVARLETSVTIKIDSLIGRMGRMEKQIASLKKRSASPPVVKVSKTSPKKSVKSPVKSPAKKKAVQSETKKSLFHTVQKGETLWSISQKYKTSVAAIRKLNNLTAKDDIYPGNNILVR